MVVYIEDAIISNIFINAILLLLSLSMTKLSFKHYQVFLSSLFGSMCSLLVSFVTMPHFATLFIKFMCGVVMVLIVMRRPTKKTFCYLYFSFLSFTFIFGGLITSLSNSFSEQVSPIVALIVICVFSYVLKGVINKFYKTKSISRFVYDLVITHHGKTKKIRSYLDSGNMLVDSDSGLPVIILEHTLFENMFEITLLDVVSGALNKKIKGHYITYATLSNSSRIFVCELDSISISINNTLQPIHALVGTTYKGSFANSFDALLNPLVFN